MNNPATTLARAFGTAFLGATLLGWAPNQLLGENGLFVTNAAHNFVHLATAMAFFAVARWGENASIRFMRIFGAVYMLTAVIGFFALGSETEGHLFYMIRINQLDNYLHLGLGIVISIAGWTVRHSYPHPECLSANLGIAPKTK